MSNFFALLNDSDDDEPKVAVKKATPKNPKTISKTTKTVAPTIIEPSKKGGKNEKYDKRDSNTREKKSFADKNASEGKRTFERKSGTGRGKEVAKGGNGSRNWGSEKQDAVKAEGAPVAAAEGGEETADATEEVEVVVEEEDNTMSYDEFMAAKAASAPQSEQFAALNIREVDNEFNAISGSGAELTDFLVMGEGKALRKKGDKSAKPTKQVIAAAFKVVDSNAPPSEDDRGGRGGRGGGRGDRKPREGGERRERPEGGRGGRGGRGPRPARGAGGAAAPKTGPVNVLDASSFPSLS